MSHEVLETDTMTSLVPVENAVERVGFSVKGVGDDQKVFLPEAEEFPVHCTGETEKVCGVSDEKTCLYRGSVFVLSLCLHATMLIHLYL